MDLLFKFQSKDEAIQVGLQMGITSQTEDGYETASIYGPPLIAIEVIGYWKPEPDLGQPLAWWVLIRADESFVPPVEVTDYIAWTSTMTTETAEGVVVSVERDATMPDRRFA